MTSDNGIVWEEPPPSGQGNHHSRGKHHAIAAQLRSNPGQWAKVAVGAGALATDIKRARLAAYLPAGSFEAVGRNRRMVDDRFVFDVYARYVGDGK